MTEGIYDITTGKTIDTDDLGATIAAEIEAALNNN